MTEPHPGAELEQAGLGRRRRRRSRDPEPPGCPPHQARVAGRVGRRELQQAPGLGRKSADPPPECLLDAPRDRYRVRQPEPARQLRRGHSPHQLQQRQRVAACLGDDLVADLLIQRSSQHRVQQRARIAVPQRPDHQLRQSGQLAAQNARRENQTDRFCLQAARDKRQDLRGGMIEPLLVIHQANQRPLPSYLRQQAQHSQTDQEPVWCRTGTETQRSPQRITRQNRETIDVIQHRRAQLLQRGEREFHLRLDTRSPRYAAIRRRPPGQVVQQRCLAHTRLVAHHKCSALTRPDSIDQPVQHAALAAPARQARRASSDRPRFHRGRATRWIRSAQPRLRRSETCGAAWVRMAEDR